MNRIRPHFLFFICFILTAVAYGQSSKRIVQLSGVVYSRDSTVGPMPGVHVYVPKAGRGDITNPVGYFSMPVQIMDSVVISMVGYKRQHYIVPHDAREFQTIMVQMVEDTTYLDPVHIMSLPTEEMFKEAVLALNAPLNAEGMDKRNLNAELLALMIQSTPMDANMNFKMYMDQFSNSARESFQPRSNPFLNPFNWARFIRDLSGKQQKKKKK